MSWSTSMRVRQKTIAAVGDSTSRMRPRAAGLCARGDDVGGLAHERAPRPATGAGSAMRMRTGSSRWRRAMRADARRHRRREEHGLAGRRGSRRGSPRCPRRSPCRASRRPRRAPRRRAGRAGGCPRPMWSRARPGRGHDDVDAALERRAAGGRSAARRRSAARARRAPRPYRWIASDTCMASSRVGTSTSAPGGAWPRPSAAIRWSSGSAKAAVLPVPVAAWPEQVAPLEQRRDRLALDRRRLLVAEARERRQELRAQPEIGEGGPVRGGVRRRPRVPLALPG